MLPQGGRLQDLRLSGSTTNLGWQNSSATVKTLSAFYLFIYFKTVKQLEIYTTSALILIPHQTARDQSRAQTGASVQPHTSHIQHTRAVSAPPEKYTINCRLLTEYSQAD